MTSTER